MSGNLLAGKVALVTGAARGQGRSHAVRLAQEGADIIAVDLCDQPETVSQPGSTPEDLEETASQIERLDRRVHAAIADVTDLPRLRAAAEEGIAELGGRLDVVCANAGIWAVGAEAGEGRDLRPGIWDETIAINLTGVWNTLEVTVPTMIDAGNGGSIVMTSSTAGVKPMATIGGMTSLAQAAQTAYTAAKHGVLGLMRNYALELAEHRIRVNAVMPTGTASPMIENEVTTTLMQAHPELGELMRNALPVDVIEPVDISNAILFLASDNGRYVTGVALPVDAGFLLC
jgi:SDR family mycofactocin-dependent oxidoreductase